MDPEDFTDICHLNTASDDAAANNSYRHCWNIEWSANGKLLAVQVEVPRFRDTRATCEVQIYDVTSGQRMQCLVLQADRAYIMWSSGLHMVSVYSTERGAVLDTSSDSDYDDGRVFSLTNTVRVMDPSKQTVAVVPEELALQKGRAWYDCCWSPCGRLLVAYCDSQTSTSGGHIYLLDAFTLTPIFTAAATLTSISWGLLSCPGQPASLMAYMPEIRLHARIWQASGVWQVEQMPMQVDEYSSGWMTPDGRSLLYYHRTSGIAVQA